MRILKTGVLGAGTMGAQIALHLANAGVPAVLLDVTREAAAQGLQKALRLKPDPTFTPDSARLVRTGSFVEDLALIGDADWVVEAVVENLEAKRALLARVIDACRADAILSTNTSGIPVGAIAEGWPRGVRRRWLGTHFFNPPRYLPLLELIPTADTDPAVLESIAEFGGRGLGKGVVVAKDTPNFIANHIGLHGVAALIRAVEAGRCTIDEADTITGAAIGRPASATFRTMDIAGIDVVAHVLKNLEDRLPEAADRAWFARPPLLARLIERGAFGEKSGRGFYERRKDASGASAIHTLDPATLGLRRAEAGGVPVARGGDGHRRSRHCVRTPFTGAGKVGALLRDARAHAGLRRAGRRRHRALDRRRRSRHAGAGFRLELGPFELIDAIGPPPWSRRPAPPASATCCRVSWHRVAASRRSASARVPCRPPVRDD
ncbi:MAG: 3-hydroxyacyl-CoA dehydrogenase family protein [Vicinamibacterales bacterium]